MARGNQPAAEKRLLVFTIQLENFSEQILKHLNCGFHVCMSGALNGTDLLPKLTPVIDLNQ
jgi:hypothetical protein